MSGINDYGLDPHAFDITWAPQPGAHVPQGYEEAYNLPPSISPDMSVKGKSFAVDGRELLVPLVIGLLALLALVGKD